jgi:hypothetical protein
MRKALLRFGDTSKWFGKHCGVTRDQSHHTQGAAIVVLRKIKCHHNLATPTVLLLDPGWSA